MLRGLGVISIAGERSEPCLIPQEGIESWSPALEGIVIVSTAPRAGSVVTCLIPQEGIESF